MTKPNRRTFLRTGAMGLAATAVFSPAWAEKEKLREDDPIAIALGYKEAASNVDVAKFPKRAGAEGAKQLCSNCALYGAPSEGYGTCSAFPGKLVAGAGWCNAWIPQA